MPTFDKSVLNSPILNIILELSKEKAEGSKTNVEADRPKTKLDKLPLLREAGIRSSSVEGL
jgi:hypothetical protein